MIDNCDMNLFDPENMEDKKVDCHDKVLEQEVRQLEKEFAALVGILRSEKVITDRHMKQIFPEAENIKTCLTCDRFGIDCGTCSAADEE